ncbi:MAG: hypothetical protein R3F62_26440 [Planctomycetota bacterium]
MSEALSACLDDALAARLPAPAWSLGLDALAPRVPAPPVSPGPLANRLEQVAAAAAARRRGPQRPGARERALARLGPGGPGRPSGR